MAGDYKALKEAFVSNLTGSSVWEVYEIGFVPPSAVLLWSVLQARHTFFEPYTPRAYLVDFLLNCLGILFATTIYSSVPLLLNLLLVAPAITSYAIAPSRPTASIGSRAARPNTNADDATKRDEQKELLPIKPFITNWRGAMIVVTCAAILAVDFRIFPRRFAKVENWGTSLMDMGVGSFVFTAGVVGARPILKQRLSSTTQSFASQFVASLRHALPLWVLGFVRLYSVKKVNYAEHVTEYGVHWNFFFTLALLSPFVAIFQAWFSSETSFTASSLAVAIAYEMALDFTDLKKYVLTAPRTDILSQNREGVFSFLGYLSIFLAGQATGMYALPRDEAMSTSSSVLWRLRSSSTFTKLVRWCAIWTTMFIVSSNYYGLSFEVSRRLANLPYVLWVISFNTLQLVLFCAIEVALFPGLYKGDDRMTETKKCKEATSGVLQAFNRNGLAIFLLANLLTGGVNLTVHTIHVHHGTAMGILVTYMGILCALALALDHWDISLKL
ncbi:MAG: Glucosaminyl phosphatidylinositol (GlcN-PI) nositol acylation protein [Bathelium mastoideum]|nr:MAG: Glucosaminyl phosphatidylinositol (GlcN-PI) nositol acylation protein [Bathelium mastoideum]